MPIEKHYKNFPAAGDVSPGENPSTSLDLWDICNEQPPEPSPQCVHCEQQDVPTVDHKYPALVTVSRSKGLHTPRSRHSCTSEAHAGPNPARPAAERRARVGIAYASYSTRCMRCIRNPRPALFSLSLSLPQHAHLSPPYAPSPAPLPRRSRPHEFSSRPRWPRRSPLPQVQISTTRREPENSHDLAVKIHNLLCLSVIFKIITKYT